MAQISTLSWLPCMRMRPSERLTCARSFYIRLDVVHYVEGLSISLERKACYAGSGFFYFVMVGCIVPGYPGRRPIPRT